MRRTFVFALFRDDRQPDRWQNKILGSDLPRQAKYVDVVHPAIVFCWGEENYSAARKYGFDAVLVDPRPFVWDGRTNNMWRHKLAAFQLAMKDHSEIIYLDMDVKVNGPLPADLWERLRTKDSIQASLYQYRRRRSPWRRADPRKSPLGSFVYIRDGRIPKRLIEISSCNPMWTDEQCMSYCMDERAGGWRGVEYWAEHNEPYCFPIRNSALPPQLREFKVAVFTL